eukprot:Hpha_TRINITY_DN30711_c0_g1::TRINITY_DN30711_c0_g1_i1::g.28312::m.28312
MGCYGGILHVVTAAVLCAPAWASESVGAECSVEGGGEYERARELLQDGARQDAVPLLECVLGRDPEHHDALYWLAFAILTTRAGAAATAVSLLSRVKVERLRDASPVDALMLHGQAWERRGVAKVAAQWYLAAVRHSQANPDDNSPRVGLAAYGLARMLLLQGKRKAASKTAREALRMWPGVWHNIDAYAAAQHTAADAARVYTAAQPRLEALPASTRTLALAVFGSTLALRELNERTGIAAQAVGPPPKAGWDS